MIPELLGLHRIRDLKVTCKAEFVLTMQAFFTAFCMHVTFRFCIQSIKCYPKSDAAPRVETSSASRAFHAHDT